jgi:hypothetical protein
MIELDELKDMWVEHDHKLDAIIRLNRRLLNAQTLNRARSALERLIFFLSLEAVIQLIAIAALGAFLYDNIGRPRFLLPAVVLDGLAIASLAAVIQQIVGARQIDYQMPVSAIQKRIERLRLERIRLTRWTLLVSPLVWTPLFVVALKGFFDVDAYESFGVPYLLANLLVGLAVILVALWLSRIVGKRFGDSAFVRRLTNDLAGHNLNAAAGVLASIARFEDEEAID